MENPTRTSARKKMHQTTVRFGDDLWRALEVEAESLGVSVAQYVRDAALSRLSYDAGRDNPFVPALVNDGPARPSEVRSARDRASDELSDSAALAAQSRQARSRAADLRARAESTRAKLVHLRT
jgi:hypothetical protein